MLNLFRHCHVFAPDDIGLNDILTAGDRIISIAGEIDPGPIQDMEIIDCSGLKLVPGLIDGHAHIAGAGGEGGPATRTPEMQLTDFLKNGITTVIGMLGTDGLARHPDSVLMKARSFKEEGLSAYILTGSYQIPPVSITGDIGRDIVLIPEVMGAGEIAVSDHRDSAPQWQELARLAKSVRVAGMLAGKNGVVCLHLGDAPNTFNIILDAIEKGNCPFKHFLPTHCNRSADVFGRAVEYALKGGFLDLTTSAYPFFPDEEIKPSEAAGMLLAKGVPLDRICMSTDAGGSLPDFDSDGKLRSLTTGNPNTLFNELRDMVQEAGIPLETALRFAGKNVADLFGLGAKGRITGGADADLLFIDETFSIRHVLARGRFAVRDGDLQLSGTFQHKSAGC
ncbi:beta-aspartyl-peptidase [bacterium]|nr:beta-aspartyl-peptidase [candidate division CSSED10-310 bacterium]